MTRVRGLPRNRPEIEATGNRTFALRRNPEVRLKVRENMLPKGRIHRYHSDYESHENGGDHL
jgi:hypothetical protein